MLSYTKNNKQLKLREAMYPHSDSSFVFESKRASTWFRRMFRIVKNKNITGWSLCGNDARVLGHIACPVHFSFMVDLDFYFNFSTNRAKTSKFCKYNKLTANEDKARATLCHSKYDTGKAFNQRTGVILEAI